jgi:hypothetical protein
MEETAGNCFYKMTASISVCDRLVSVKEFLDDDDDKFYVIGHRVTNHFCTEKQEPNSSVTSCDGAKERQRHD